MNKFYANLMSQNRKRTHDASNVNGEANTNGKGEHGQTETSPVSKRTLLNSNQSIKAGLNGKQSMRMPQKSIKPTQSINLLNAPEEIYYAANRSLK
jgi:hypothetical protein